MDDRVNQRSGYPLTIPDVLLQSECMRRACITRNFGEIFRLVNRRTGSSYADIAAAIGKMSSARVSDIIRGVRGIRGQGVMERVADGFGIPGHMLGLPERPWERSPSRFGSVTNTVVGVRAAGDPRSDTPRLPHHPFYFAAAQTSSGPSQFDTQKSDRAAMDSFRMADRQLGGGHLYGAVTHYLSNNVAPRVFGIKSASTAETFRAAAALTEMAGWMAHDSGHDLRARRHFRRALPLAQVGLDHALGSHIMASMSHLALQLDQPHEAVELAQAGKVAAKSGPFAPGLISRLHAMEARAFARMGQEKEFRRSIDDSAECLTLRSDELPSIWISEFDTASLASEAALCFSDLGNLSSAAGESERAVSLRTLDRTRSRVFSQISLAVIRTRMGDLDAGCATATELIDSCRTLGSLRITQQLAGLSEALQPFEDNAQVADLLESLAEVDRQRRLLLANVSPPETEGGTE